MTMRRGSRRPRPRIDYVFAGGSGSTIGTAIVTITLVAELTPANEQLHHEEVQVVGTYQVGTALANGIATLSVFSQRTGATVTHEDGGVRTRLLVGSDQGVPFIFRFKNINQKSGEALRLELTPQSESGDVSHIVRMGIKVVSRELR